MTSQSTEGNGLTQPPDAVRGLPMIGVHVSDTDRAVTFYRDVLGLAVVNDAPIAQLGGRLVILAVPGSSTVIALFPATVAEPAGVDTGIRLQIGDARAWHEHLRAAGSVVHELLEWPGVPPMFVFEDPDHNRLVVVS